MITVLFLAALILAVLGAPRVMLWAFRGRRFRQAYRQFRAEEKK